MKTFQFTLQGKLRAEDEIQAQTEVRRMYPTMAESLALGLVKVEELDSSGAVKYPHPKTSASRREIEEALKEAEQQRVFTRGAHQVGAIIYYRNPDTELLQGLLVGYTQQHHSGTLQFLYPDEGDTGYRPGLNQQVVINKLFPDSDFTTTGQHLLFHTEDLQWLVRWTVVDVRENRSPSNPWYECKLWIENRYGEKLAAVARGWGAEIYHMQVTLRNGFHRVAEVFDVAVSSGLILNLEEVFGPYDASWEGGPW